MNGCDSFTTGQQGRAEGNRSASDRHPNRAVPRMAPRQDTAALGAEPSAPERLWNQHTGQEGAFKMLPSSTDRWRRLIATPGLTGQICCGLGLTSSEGTFTASLGALPPSVLGTGIVFSFIFGCCDEWRRRRARCCPEEELTPRYLVHCCPFGRSEPQLLQGRFVVGLVGTQRMAMTFPAVTPQGWEFLRAAGSACSGLGATAPLPRLWARPCTALAFSAGAHGDRAIFK